MSEAADARLILLQAPPQLAPITHHEAAALSD